MRFSALLRQPTAFPQIAMSLAALSLVVFHVARFGVARQADEDASAHLWQLLMAGQLPVLAAFAIQWLPRSSRQALFVLAIQFVAALAAAAPIFVLDF